VVERIFGPLGATIATSEDLIIYFSRDMKSSRRIATVRIDLESPFRADCLHTAVRVRDRNRRLPYSSDAG